MKNGLKDRELTGKFIAAAIAVHRDLGPGFLESLCEKALCIELDWLQISFERQKRVPLYYRSRRIGEHRLDLFLDNSVVIELKAIKALEAIHFTMVRSYMKATGVESGLLFNFATMPLTIKRVGREGQNLVL